LGKGASVLKMKHLIICREYPPAPGGGIGTYAFNISRLLAENGETVHVISQLWEGAEKAVEETCNGRLIVHRVPFEDWTAFLRPKPSPLLRSKEALRLFKSSFYPQAFAWTAGLLAERLVVEEGIDIIEAQEYEAPLYYFQLRRALGEGPKEKPPCIVHLHSPTEFIARYNDWEISTGDPIRRICQPYYQTAKRLEDYSIAAADATLCPSRYLARQVEMHYSLADGSVQVIPYPISEFPILQRDKNTYEHGSICYVGRLERRKGILEWIEAAAQVANEFPSAQFEFIGANVLGPGGAKDKRCIARQIPKHMKKRFHFRGEQPHAALPQFLSRARIAVVPSRWENFPNTCIEAMCSGLPVIASREGGMVEMIEDNRDGWLANRAGVEGLAEALQRALSTTPERLAEMGRYAASTIRQKCGAEKIVRQQLDFRNQLRHHRRGEKGRVFASVKGQMSEGAKKNPSAHDPSSVETRQSKVHDGLQQIGRQTLAKGRVIFWHPVETASLVLQRIRAKIRFRANLIFRGRNQEL
jgi:glycogen synthase